MNSVSDLFHPDVSFDYVSEIFGVMREASAKYGHIFQALMKRSERAVAWWEMNRVDYPDGWPPNIWIGTSVESQKYAPRVTVLERIPAPVRFISAEPMLEPLDLTE